MVLGFEGRLFRYPKTFQRIELIREAGNALHTRTKEGLDITLDISLEYRLNPAELADLFDLVGVSDDGDHIKPYVELYTKMAQSTLRNAGAKFNSEAFLTEKRANVSSTMLNMVNEKFKKFHATVSTVQLRNVELENKFKLKIDQVIQEKLTQSQLVKQQLVSLKNAEKDRVTKKEQAVATRQNTIIESNRQVDNAINDRLTQTIQKNQERQSTIQKSEGDQRAELNRKEGALLRVFIDRQSQTKDAQNSLSVAAIRKQDELAITIAEAKSDIIRAKAASAKIVKDGNALATGLELVKDSENTLYTKLKNLDASGSTADFGNSEVAQFVYITAMGEQAESELYLNYKKVPMFREGAQDPEAIAKLLGNK